MEEIAIEILNDYSIFIISGIVGTIAYRMSHYMSYRNLIKHLISSIFVALVVGISVSEYFDNLSTKIIFAFSSIAAYFSVDILREIKEIIDELSEYVKEFTKNKLKISKEHKCDHENEVKIDDTPEATERPPSNT